MDSKPLDRRFQILSLDGGGIKGIFSAAVLAAIEEDSNVKITDHFDLLTGTSTGGIIALGLGLEMRPKEIVEFYLEHGSKIFPSWYGAKWFQHWLFRKYSSKPLEEALKKCFKEKTLDQSIRPLVIPSYNIGIDDVYLFRTPHHERLKRDYKVPAWKVGLATSAAPTYFPCTREVDEVRLIDGGVWANNPAMVGIVEAVGTIGVPLDTISVLSIGTCEEVVARPGRLDTSGILGWALGGSAVNVIMRGQSIGANNQAKFLLEADRLYRLNPNVPPGQFSLDGIKKANDLIGIAAHHSRHLLQSFETMFKEHKAGPYSPRYRVSLEANADDGTK